MNILYISTVFPRPEDSSTIYTDLAEKLANHGHEIFIVVAEGKNNIDQTVISQERGLTVLRVRVGNLYNVGLIEKGLAAVSMSFILKRAIRKYLKELKFDFVLFESPPVTAGNLIKWTMNYFGCPSYLMLKDIFPQNAVDIEMIRNGGILHRYFRIQEENLYRIASYIGCMSEANRRYILKYNPWIPFWKLEIFPNTKRIRNRIIRPTHYPMRTKYGIPKDTVLAVFGGNMGKPQGLGFLIDIIAACRENKDLSFLLVGRGAERKSIIDRIQKEKLQNVLILDPLPREDYELLLQECDIGLIMLDQRFTIPNFPSRVLSYFEYSIPVVAATDTSTDFGDMIETSKSGFWVPAGDVELMIKRLYTLVSNKEMRCSLGEAGRRYIEEHFTVDVSAEILEKKFSNTNDYLEL